MNSKNGSQRNNAKGTEEEISRRVIVHPHDEMPCNRLQPGSKLFIQYASGSMKISEADPDVYGNLVCAKRGMLSQERRLTMLT